MWVRSRDPTDGRRAVLPRSLDEIAGSGFVRVGITSDDRPLGYISMRGNYAGYDYYFSLFLATRVGVGEVRCVAVDPKERYEALQSNRVDVLLVGASPDDEAGDGVAYVRPLYVQRLCVVSPEGAVVDSSEKLSQGELIVCEGTYAGRYAERTWPDVTLRRYETHTDTWHALEEGRGIGVLTDEVSGLSWASGAEEPFGGGMRGHRRRASGVPSRRSWAGRPVRCGRPGCEGLPQERVR